MRENGHDRKIVFMPLGNPADYPLGSVESRAAARAAAEAYPTDISTLSSSELHYRILDRFSSSGEPRGTNKTTL